MYREWLRLLQAAGWDVETEECSWTSTETKPIRGMTIEDESGKKEQFCEKAEGFKVLGTIFTADKHTDKELQHRVARTWKTWYRWKAVLCCRSTPPAGRLKLAEKRFEACNVVVFGFVECEGAAKS